MKKRKAPPNYGKFMDSLRNFGYSFHVAVADLVDNSIEAKASAISIQVNFADHSKKVHVSIADNGTGMNENELDQAMRYGSITSTEDHRLGRYGLGLKTASFAFCTKLYVTSRRSKNAKLLSACWDLDLIAEDNDWSLLLDDSPPDLKDDFAEAEEELELISGTKAKSGTLVTWTDVDRLLIKNDGGEYQNVTTAMQNKINKLEEHLGRHFHRFLDPKDKRASNVKIHVNGKPVVVNSPFNFSLIKKLDGESTGVRDRDTGKEGRFEYTSYLVPHKDDLDLEDPCYKENKKFVDDNTGMKQQGIYVYRENRLVSGPSWLGKWVPETHQNRHIIEFDYQSTIDHLFKVDVMKGSLQPAEAIIDWIAKELVGPRRHADTESRGRKTVVPEPGNNPTNKDIGRTKNQLDGPDIHTKGKSIAMGNNVTPPGENLELFDISGEPNPGLMITLNAEQKDEYVTYSSETKDGSLWEPTLNKFEDKPAHVQVTINTAHDWYQKTIAANKNNSDLVKSYELMLYALAQSEMNNVDEAFFPVFEDFRINVSKNLRKLSEVLPEPDDD